MRIDRGAAAVLTPLTNVISMKARHHTRRRHHDPISPQTRRVKKVRFPPANERDVFQAINEVRESIGLSPLELQPQFSNLKGLLQDPTDRREEAIQSLRDLPEDLSSKHGRVGLSLLSAFDILDEKMSTYDVIGRWMADPGKRPVVLAPGNYGYVGFEETQNMARRVCLIVAYVYK
jgi:hypothetical protein